IPIIAVAVAGIIIPVVQVARDVRHAEYEIHHVVGPDHVNPRDRGQARAQDWITQTVQLQHRRRRRDNSMRLRHANRYTAIKASSAVDTDRPAKSPDIFWLIRKEDLRIHGIESRRYE